MIRFIAALTAKYVYNKKVIITYHGQVGRYKQILNYLEKITFRIVDISLLLNKSSYNLVEGNKALISSYIKSSFDEWHDPNLHNYLRSFKNENKYTFCTNAFSFKNKYGIEIYNVSLLIELFSKLPNYGLIVSDPSGLNRKNISNNLTKNIHFVNYIHDFNDVLNNSDAFIRLTTTDGDSISIHEALQLNKNVIATDCVERPNGCFIVSLYDKMDILNCIMSLAEGETTALKRSKSEYNIDRISMEEVYNKLL